MARICGAHAPRSARSAHGLLVRPQAGRPGAGNHLRKGDHDRSPHTGRWRNRRSGDGSRAHHQKHSPAPHGQGAAARPPGSAWRSGDLQAGFPCPEPAARKPWAESLCQSAQRCRRHPAPARYLRNPSGTAALPGLQHRRRDMGCCVPLSPSQRTHGPADGLWLQHAIRGQTLCEPTGRGSLCGNGASGPCCLSHGT